MRHQSPRLPPHLRLPLLVLLPVLRQARRDEHAEAGADAAHATREREQQDRVQPDRGTGILGRLVLYSIHDALCMQVTGRAVRDCRTTRQGSARTVTMKLADARGGEGKRRGRLGYDFGTLWDRPLTQCCLRAWPPRSTCRRCRRREPPAGIRSRCRSWSKGWGNCHRDRSAVVSAPSAPFMRSIRRMGRRNRGVEPGP
jgi:hypothetical protein